MKVIVYCMDMNGSHHKQDHTGIAASLATASFYGNDVCNDHHFSEINIKDIKVRRGIAFSGLFVAFMVGIHRVSKGCHGFSRFYDRMFNRLLHWICFLDKSLEYFKKLYYKLCKGRGGGNGEGDLCENAKYAETDDEIEYWTNNYNVFKLKLFDDNNINTAIGIARIIIKITFYI